jgi:hypothetical protein
LILLVLIIEFFQRALYLEYAGALDLHYLALSTLLIGAAFYLASLVKGHGDSGTPPPAAGRAAHEAARRAAAAPGRGDTRCHRRGSIPDRIGDSPPWPGAAANRYSGRTGRATRGADEAHR